MWPRNTKPTVTLIDQNDRFLFKPLMYELLLKAADELEVAPEYTTLLAPHNVRTQTDSAARCGTRSAHPSA
jgi:demethylphylloquinone reductase